MKERSRSEKKLLFPEQTHKVNTCLMGISYLIEEPEESTNFYSCLFDGKPNCSLLFIYRC